MLWSATAADYESMKCRKSRGGRSGIGTGCGGSGGGGGRGGIGWLYRERAVGVGVGAAGLDILLRESAHDLAGDLFHVCG